MPDFVDVTICGERLRLRADRSLFWPRLQTLMIADLHLGKADTFRSAGIALPSGGTRNDLSRLTSAIERTGASRVIVLGDMLHAAATEKRWRESWDSWRERHADLRVVAIGGNHDRALKNLNLHIEHHIDSIPIPPFELRHAPRIASERHVICGHIHPVVRLPRMLGRWPAFVMDNRQTLLPAFSMFTGGGEVDIVGKRLAVCDDDNIALVETQGETIRSQTTAK